MTTTLTRPTVTAHDPIRHAIEQSLRDRIWRAYALDNSPPIDPWTMRTAAAQVAAEAAAEFVAERLPLERRPPLMRDLHERIPWSAWRRSGLLAAALRREADRLDGVAHRAMVTEAEVVG